MSDDLFPLQTQTQTLVLNEFTKLLQVTFTSPHTLQQMNFQNDNALFIRINATTVPQNQIELIEFGERI